MSGETNLAKLLSSMQPEIMPDEYVFVSLTREQSSHLAELNPLGTFAEQEGLSVILLKSQAEQQGWDYQGVFRLISLKVHSSLSAVGLTAAISSALAMQGISANVVAAYFHDHIFVPSEAAEQALTCLSQLTLNSKE
ncbi:ACT domain-containing protein [Paraglaciecola aestuariivivens]